ncbi:DUF4064 domain-containing protein [Paenibacillus urinalis]|uniref:DUF4064 domain-containing protein n=1 Tax=Paenibacillus urinalis TaxID=521520 RepID=A0AAX3MTF3_9BACL|nr:MULTISPECIES: DUF4064 domain-containing protein [Paenibacillus]WDH80592.1 DUF4064 domain-containing protein [Paenibacillus urinalis]WDH96639.1 DUF4064 domain-containing protein [Paenibacillus urinalis]WDI00283.1 DUF4064 domain-containing protein [Paenibacillus urinalis]GAK40790.1 hypothetical protein TCA2_3280 [Paenibacillus sp. TCA20]
MFAMGLIAGIFGIIASIVALMIGGVDAAFSDSGTSSITGLAISAMIFSILGIIGSAMAKSKPKIAGIIMLVSGIAGFISISMFFILSGVLFVVAGFMGILSKKKSVNIEA